MSKTFIVEVEGFEGERGAIVVENDDVPSPQPRLYCIGLLKDDHDGVIRFVDWGYPTIKSARAAWPEAEPAPVSRSKRGARSRVRNT